MTWKGEHLHELHPMTTGSEMIGRTAFRGKELLVPTMNLDLDRRHLSDIGVPWCSYSYLPSVHLSGILQLRFKRSCNATCIIISARKYGDGLSPLRLNR